MHLSLNVVACAMRTKNSYAGCANVVCFDLDRGPKKVDVRMNGHEVKVTGIAYPATRSFWVTNLGAIT